MLNNFVSLVLEESVLHSPFASKFLFVDPAVMASIISGGASLASSGISALSTGAANSKTIAIANDSRRWQSEENQKARDWSREMWNLENQYNTPFNQKKLAQEAGYNPYLLSTQSLGSGSSTPSSPSMQSAPHSPEVRPLPFAGMADSVNKGLSTFQQMMAIKQNQEQIDANKEEQHAKTLQLLFQVEMDALEKGGGKMARQVREDFKDVFKAVDFENSPYEQMFRKQMLRQDIENERNDIARSVESMYSKDTANATLKNLNRTYELMGSQIDSLETQSDLNEAYIKRVASEIARNFAEAFNAKKQGDYYEVSAGQLGIINKMLDMEEQEKEADFAFGTAVRKYKKEIPNRSQALGLFLGDIKSRSVEQEVSGNKFLRYTKEVTGAVGNMFKLNFGASVNSTDFFNRTPKSNTQMFYSGDGYYMNNGVLMKGSW